MAASYTVVSQVREVQVLGPNLMLDVQTIGFVTHPTAIQAQFPVPYEAFKAEGTGPWIGPLADTIEGLISNTAAVTATFVQDLDVSGLIADYLNFIVEYRPPNSLVPAQQTTVRVPIGLLSAATDPFVERLTDSPENLIGAAYAALVAAAEL